MVRVSALGFMGLALVSTLALTGCQTPNTFAEDAAEISCSLAQECSPQLFEARCAPLCQDAEECGPGNRCNLLTHLCEDETTLEVLGTEKLWDPCASDEECGGQLCGKVYSNFAACEAGVHEFYDDKEEHCEFNADAAAECIRLSRARSCGDPGAEICRSVYADSTCYY